MKAQMSRVFATIVAAATAASLAACSDDTTDRQDQAESESTVQTEEQQGIGNTPYGYTSDDNEKARRWPRITFDDSTFTPGEWTMDVTGAPVYVPNDPNGEPLERGESADVDLIAECQPATRQLNPQNINVQYIHGRYVLFSTDGPWEVTSDGVPVQYAKTAAGAMISFFNIQSLTAVARDKYATRVANTFLDGAENYDELKTEDPARIHSIIRPVTQWRVSSCAGNMANVELANKMLPGADEMGDWLVRSATMIYRDGNWLIQLGEKDIRRAGGEFINGDLPGDGWTEVEYT